MGWKRFMNTIHKIGGVIIKDRKLLVGRKKDTFLMPGGKIKSGETHIECLKRELKEEFCVELISAKYFLACSDKAALEAETIVKMDTYLVNIEGNPKPSMEIEEMSYVNSNTNLKIASIIKKVIIPELKKKDLID
jgi:8-oxo-dGTP diphosphatase